MIDNFSDIEHQSNNYSKSGGSNNLLNYAKKLQTEGIDRHPSLQNYIKYQDVQD